MPEITPTALLRLPEAFARFPNERWSLSGPGVKEPTSERKQTPMNKMVHYVGLDVHKESIAVAIASSESEVRCYGTLGGQARTLAY